jgi:hypothetical protein
MSTSDRIFRRKVQQQYPEIASRVVEQPVLTDVNEITDLYHIFTSLVKLPDNSKSSEIADFRTLFIAVTLRLYDPDYVNGYKKKVRNGLRSMIAYLFEIDFNYVSCLFALAVARVQIYKSMADNVEKIYSVILQSIENE